MTEERKHGILFAATILAAQKLNETVSCYNKPRGFFKNAWVPHRKRF